MTKKRRDYPKLNLRISNEMHAWLRDYAERQGKGMSAIIKEYLEELWHKDERDPRRAQRETTS